MPPRIRSFAVRPPYLRAFQSPAPEAPSVFREFVETLQRLDAAKHPPGNGATRKRAFGSRAGNGTRRRYLGNGHARSRQRPQPHS